MNEEILKSIAGKLVTTRDYRSLSPADVQELRSLAGIQEEEPGGEEECPLWVLMQKNLLTFGESVDVMDKLDHHTDEFLRKCSDAPLTDENDFARFAYPVRRSRLLETTKEILVSSSFFTLAQAIQVAGLADLKELAPAMAARLQDGSVFKETLGDMLGAAMIRSLVMLDQSLAARVIASLGRNAPKEAISPIMAFCSRYPDLVSDETLRELFRWEMEPEELRAGMRLLGRAAKAGVDILAYVDKIMEAVGTTFSAKFTEEEAAVVLVGHGSAEQIRSALARGIEPLSAALLTRLCWSGRSDVLGVLNGKVEEEDAPTLQSLRRLAISTLENKPLPPTYDFPEGRGMYLDVPLAELWMSLHHSERNEVILKGLRSNDEIIRFSARCVQLLNTGYDVGEMEFLAARMLRDGVGLATGLLLRALEAERVDLPPTTRDHQLMGSGWNPDAALEFYREHPLHLMRRLAERGLQGPGGQEFSASIRAMLLAGVIGGRQLREYTENVYVFAGLSGVEEVAGKLFFALLGMGGSVTPFGKTLDRLLTRKGAKNVAWDDADAIPLMLYSVSSSEEIPQRALAALARIRPFPEQLTEVFLFQPSEAEKAEAAAGALLQVPGSESPLAERMKEILGEGLCRVEDIPGLAMMLLSGSAKVRGAIARLLAAEDPPPPEWALYSCALLQKPLDREDATNVYRALGRRIHDAGWIRNLLMLAAYDDFRGSGAIRAIGELEDLGFVQPLLELLASKDPESVRYNDAVNEAVAALQRILAANRALPVIVLSAHDPKDVNRVFAMKEEYSFMEDPRSEALRLIMLGLERCKNPAFAAASRGKKILLQHIDRTTTTPSTAGLALTRQQFEELALYLKVQYVDAESGTIVAEVGEATTGEIVNALFEGRWYVAIRCVWS